MKKGAQTSQNAWLKRHGTQVWKPVYGRLGSMRYDFGMLACQRKNGCALTALDGNYGIKTQGVALGCPVAAFQALYSHRHAGRPRPTQADPGR